MWWLGAEKENSLLSTLRVVKQHLKLGSPRKAFMAMKEWKPTGSLRQWWLLAAKEGLVLVLELHLFWAGFMVAVVILWGRLSVQACFSHQENGVYFCGIKYLEDGLTLAEPEPGAPAPRLQIIEENIQILQGENVEFISVPVPEFADSDPADIVHDFQRTYKLPDLSQITSLSRQGDLQITVKEALRGIQKREVTNCRKIRHFENRFAVETLICEQ
uniref:Uncharacterized protein n=1 Tax=Sphaerodactylus townsendi TaxID=933632 RepID=A0ACB8GEN7_9SAUR